MVKRLRRRPLTAETGVRFPMGLPKKHTTISSCVFCFTSDRVFHIALQAVILARRDAVFFIARKPLFLHGGTRCFLLRASHVFLHGGAWCFYCTQAVILAWRGAVFFYCAQAVYSCTAGRGVFLLLCKPVILARRGVVFFLPCKPRRVLHGKMRGCNRTTNRIFHGKLHILYWHSPLYGKPCVFFMEEHPPAQNFCAGGCSFVTTLR